MNENLRRAFLSRADFQGANLDGADLTIKCQASLRCRSDPHFFGAEILPSPGGQKNSREDWRSNRRSRGEKMVILSSPLAHFPGQGRVVIEAEESSFPTDLTGYVSYVGHPATRELLEALGASTVSGRWEGPQIGEEYLAVPLANNPREDGYTRDTAISSVAELRAVKLRRLA